MKYETTITSKGTITIAAPLRKALGLRPGQKVRMELDKKNNRVLIETGFSLEQLEAIRDDVLSRHPGRPQGLSLKQMRDLANKKWLAERIAKHK